MLAYCETQEDPFVDESTVRWGSESTIRWTEEDEFEEDTRVDPHPWGSTVGTALDPDDTLPPLEPGRSGSYASLDCFGWGLPWTTAPRTTPATAPRTSKFWLL